MAKTRNLTVRVDEETYREIEENAEKENVDKSTIARGLLKMGLREKKKTQAVESYRKGSSTLWKAAEMAGLNLREMMMLLGEERIPLHITPDDVDEAWREAFER